MKRAADGQLVIRRARADDLSSILALYAQPDMDDGHVADPVRARELFDEMASYPDYTLYTATIDDRVVGTFALLIMPTLGNGGMPSGVLEDIVVASDQQGRGIGRAMVERALEICRGKGCYKLALSSNLKRTRAHAFYEGLGFERHGYSFLAKVQHHTG